MSFSVDITTHDGATQMVDGVEMAIKGGVPLHREIAAEALMIVQSRFRELASTQVNVLRDTGFWNRMLYGTVPSADKPGKPGTESEATEDAAIIRMPREVAQRYFGGTILPTGGRQNIAIPARTEAVGVNPRDFFDSLALVPFASGALALVMKNDTHRPLSKGKRKGHAVPAGQGQTATLGAGAVMYWLVKSATQAADPEVLPSDEEFLAAANRGVGNYLETFGREQ